ncbi:L-rhamnose isomerase [Candidatus Poribacteria bacterium]|nr:MAG: L-rhamnose isomerase [Candidatus Poribacteria bacterium]
MRREEELYEALVERLKGKGIDVELVKSKLKSQRIETPSWGYGDSGTRFKVFKQPGAARNVWEKIQDAAQVHKFTGVTPTVALHIPWDKVDDWKALRQYAEDLGIRIGSINPNLFQDDDYKLGSVCNVDPRIRRKAVDHMLECVEIMKQTGSEVLSVWIPDGTNYPGQGDFRARKRWLYESLKEVYDALPEGSRMLLEYKFFEPAFYHTDLCDWGSAYLMAVKLGDKAQVLIDLGHHPHGTNIQYIVAWLIDEGKLGGFHFNSRKYADDDLTAGSIDPYELFLIYNELASAELDPDVELNVAYMIDQSHNIKPKIEAMIQTVMTLQEIYAKALIVDRRSLREAQERGDVVGAEEILKEAFFTDVKPLLWKVREEMGLDPDPLQAYKRSGYYERICKERVGGESTGWASQV